MTDLVVLCNAKSLRDYPFYNYNVDTIGMNIAYRFWHQIGWYPTYYVSLDKKVNINYAKDLYFLVLNREKFGIKRFLFRKVISEVYPKLRKIPEVTFLEDIKKNSPLACHKWQFVTTGSFGIRWGAHLGYKNIYVLGVDSFTLVKPRFNPKTKRLTATLSPDPNKFFDGYQRKGDIAHIPGKKNKKRNNNHANTFKMIHKDINKKGLARVFNSHYNSKLLRHVFPYRKIPSKFMKPREEWVSFEWKEVMSGILEDRSPKITPDVKFNQITKPKRYMNNKKKSRNNVRTRQRFYI